MGQEMFERGTLCDWTRHRDWACQLATADSALADRQAGDRLGGGFGEAVAARPNCVETPPGFGHHGGIRSGRRCGPRGWAAPRCGQGAPAFGHNGAATAPPPRDDPAGWSLCETQVLEVMLI